MVIKYGPNAAFEMTYLLTKRHTNMGYYDELQGVSDSTGVPLNKLKGMHLIGELTKGHCSMFGAWGKATKDGKTL